MTDDCGSAADPAVYLAGELDPATHAWFEAHLVGCEACWSQVRDARRGRALAESLRESAPQSLRETVRALAASGDLAIADEGTAASRGPGRRRARRPALFAAAVAAGVVTVALAMTGPLLPGGGTEPDPHEQILRAAVAVYANAVEVESGARAPVAGIGALALRSSGTATLEGTAVTVFRYGEPGAGQVVLIRSPHPFPRAHASRDIAGAPGWLGTVEGSAVYCRDTAALSWLVIAATTEQALAAGHAAGLMSAPAGRPPIRAS